MTRLRARLERAVLRSRVLRAVIRLHLEQPLIYGPRDRVRVHPGAQINNAVLNVNSGTITIGRGVMFGHRVSVVTGVHEFERFDEERLPFPTEGRDIVIGEGAWIATNATVLGPCRVGRHAVVAAGAVVTRNVADYEVVAGVPARPVRSLRPADAGP